MTKSLTMIVCFVPLIFAVPASANIVTDQGSSPMAATQADGKVLPLARHGADDKPGDDHGGGKGGKGRGGQDDGNNHA
jgi:hypothetical protein